MKNFCLIILILSISSLSFSQIRTLKIIGVSVNTFKGDSWTGWSDISNLNGVITINIDKLFIRVVTEDMISTFDIIIFSEEIDTENQDVLIFNCVSRSGIITELRLRKDDLMIVLDEMIIAYIIYAIE